MILVIDDDEIMAECVARAVRKVAPVKIVSDAIAAMEGISQGEIPELVFLDILLDGPDGFTFLNEIVSYTDTAKIPIVIVSSLDFLKDDLGGYGVVGVLKKETMRPADIKKYALEYTGQK